MKKKVLVLYARYGSGHKSIAEYVASYIKEHNDKCIVKLIDMSDYGNFIGRAGVKIMDFVGKRRTAHIFDFFYELMDHKISTLGHNALAKKSYDNERLRQVISEFNPDITISTHFYCSNIITYYNKLKLIHSKLLTIITDYRSHECWTKNHKVEDGYIVGNEMVKEELISRGIDGKKVYPFGLPLNINEINNLDSEDVIYRRYNLSGKRRVYLFFGGSTTGSMYYYDYFKTIAKLDLDVDIIFISGKNEKLKDKCDMYVKEKDISNIKVLGYSHDVLNLMKISDLVISKPGGATVTESMEMKVPMLLVPGVGGQEKYNARFIAFKKYGLKVRNTRAFKKVLLKIENNYNIVLKMKERLNKLDNNKSVEKINNLINKM